MDRRTVTRGIILGIAAMALLVLIAFLWVLVYAGLIAPGHDGAFYQAYAARVSPISGLIAGVPILLAAGYLTARGSEGRNLLASSVPAIVYLMLDAVILTLFMPGGWRAWPLLLISWMTKVAAALGGGWLSARNQRLPAQ